MPSQSNLVTATPTRALLNAPPSEIVISHRNPQRAEVIVGCSVISRDYVRRLICHFGGLCSDYDESKERWMR
ncbi:hypothetical protein AAC387_Pa10g0644 [Persea americana]